jgi:PKD repeat protein
VSNIEFNGETVVAGGINSIFTGNTNGWLPNDCEELVAGNFAVAFACTNSSTEFIPSVNGSEVEYLWNFGLEAAGEANQSTQQFPTFSYDEPGEYVVTMTAFNSINSITKKQTININSNSLNQPEINDLGEDGLFSSVSGSEYQWYKDGLPIPEGTSRLLQNIEEGIYQVAITDGNSCRRFSELYEYILTSSEQELAGYGIVLYPNPASNTIQLQMESAFVGEVYVALSDLSGRTIATSTFRKDSGKTTFPIKVKGLPKGYYFIKMENAEGMAVNTKFIKE